MRRHINEKSPRLVGCFRNWTQSRPHYPGQEDTTCTWCKKVGLYRQVDVVGKRVVFACAAHKANLLPYSLARSARSQAGYEQARSRVTNDIGRISASRVKR